MSFETLLEQSYQELREQSEMTPNQRTKVNKLKSLNWVIESSGTDKVTMKRDGREAFVYNSGAASLVTEDGEYDMDLIIEAMADDSELLEENMMRSMIGRLRSANPRITVYSNGRDGAIALAKHEGMFSIFHSVKGQAVFEESNMSFDKSQDYIEMYEGRGYRRIRDNRMLLSVLGSVAAAGAIALGAGTIAAIGLRVIFGLVSAQNATEAEELNIEDAVTVKRNLSGLIQRGYSVGRDGEITLNGEEIEKPRSISELLERHDEEAAERLAEQAQEFSLLSLIASGSWFVIKKLIGGIFSTITSIFTLPFRLAWSAVT